MIKSIHDLLWVPHQPKPLATNGTKAKKEINYLRCAGCSTPLGQKGDAPMRKLGKGVYIHDSQACRRRYLTHRT